MTKRKRTEEWVGYQHIIRVIVDLDLVYKLNVKVIFRWLSRQLNICIYCERTNPCPYFEPISSPKKLYSNCGSNLLSDLIPPCIFFYSSPAGCKMFPLFIIKSNMRICFKGQIQPSKSSTNLLFNKLSLLIVLHSSQF